jgi:hypothetical protein
MEDKFPLKDSFVICISIDVDLCIYLYPGVYFDGPFIME